MLAQRPIQLCPLAMQVCGVASGRIQSHMGQRSDKGLARML